MTSRKYNKISEHANKLIDNYTLRNKPHIFLDSPRSGCSLWISISRDCSETIVDDFIYKLNSKLERTNEKV